MPYCKDHKAPLVKDANGNQVCPVEWVSEYFSEVRVKDLIPQDLACEQAGMLVMAIQVALPMDRAYNQLGGALQLRMYDAELLLGDLSGTTLTHVEYQEPYPTADGLVMTPAAYLLTFMRSPDMPEDDPNYVPVVVRVDAGAVHALIVEYPQGVNND